MSGEPLIREDVVERWIRCLEACIAVIKSTRQCLQKSRAEGVSSEVLATALSAGRGASFILDLVEVLVVGARLRTAISHYATSQSISVPAAGSQASGSLSPAWAELCEECSALSITVRYKFPSSSRRSADTPHRLTPVKMRARRSRRMHSSSTEYVDSVRTTSIPLRRALSRGVGCATTPRARTFTATACLQLLSRRGHSV